MSEMIVRNITHLVRKRDYEVKTPIIDYGLLGIPAPPLLGDFSPLFFFEGQNQEKPSKKFPKEIMAQYRVMAPERPLSADFIIMVIYISCKITKTFLDV